MVALLENEVRGSTKSGHLREALAIKAELERIADSLEPASSPGKRTLPPSDVADEATLFEGSCYLFVDESVTWFEAKRRCEEMNGHLAIIPDQEVNRFLVEFAGKTFWIGAHYNPEDGEWQWPGGDELSWESWGVANPGTYPASRLEMNGSWKPGKGDSTRPFVCQWSGP